MTGLGPHLCSQHRLPEGPNEDISVCPRCQQPTYELRPEGETFGWHRPDCSLPVRHEKECEPGGPGHPAAPVIRGYWRCPDCPHEVGEHDVDGCQRDWRYYIDDESVAGRVKVIEGCECMRPGPAAPAPVEDLR